MKASLLDRSNYYRGMLVLIGRDRIIHPDEHKLMLQVGGMLDFDKRFCEAAITNLLENEHINEDPIHFDAREMAECFLRDALKVSLVDKDLHVRELAWLQSVARTNEIPDDWLENERRLVMETALQEYSPESLEIYRHL
jgi:hypothetical protein